MLDFNLNGEDVSVDVPGEATLLAVLSNDLKLAGQKFGCGLSQCGACTVMIDGEAVRSCQTKASAAVGRSVTTLSGLKENGRASILQQAFIDEQAAQCGYCSSGMIMQAQALLDRNPAPSEIEIRTALNGNLCRCGSHNRVVRAVLRAVQEG
jgi:aerobic-type carbon monoxide dehydrogenase small subunit (CoxS/CutS family)